jgi:hypothetical protein
MSDESKANEYGYNAKAEWKTRIEKLTERDREREGKKATSTAFCSYIWSVQYTAIYIHKRVEVIRAVKNCIVIV